MEQPDGIDSRRLGVLDGRPTHDDPAIVLSREGPWLVCWVEAVEDENHWVAATADGAEHVGPVYAGEETLEGVGDAIRRWWTRHDRGRTSPGRYTARRV